MKRLILLLCVLLASFTFAQDGKNPLEAFNNLTDGSWVYEAETDEGKYKQVVEYEWSLDRKIVKVKSYDALNAEPGAELPLRNEGIRAYDKDKNEILFWEFDKYGGITTGTVHIEGSSIVYEYMYDTASGRKLIRDTWTMTDENTYAFKIEIEDGESRSTWAEGKFIRTEE